MKNCLKNSHFVLVTSFFALMLAWWLYIHFKGLVDTNTNYYYGLTIGVFSVLGGIVGIIKSERWGFLSSYLGKSIFFLAVGLISWGIGSIIFAYYNIFFNVAVPYPSIADAAYVLSWPLWATGMIFLLRSLGIKYRLKKLSVRLFMIFVPLITIIISYFLLFTIARGGGVDLTESPMKAFFDLAYPIGDIVILTMTALIYSISVNYLGGVFKPVVLVIMLGFVLNYIADFGFSYTTTNNTFHVAGWVDLVFTLTIFVLSAGISLFDPKIVSSADSKAAITNEVKI